MSSTPQHMRLAFICKILKYHWAWTKINDIKYLISKYWNFFSTITYWTLVHDPGELKSNFFQQFINISQTHYRDPSDRPRKRSGTHRHWLYSGHRPHRIRSSSSLHWGLYWPINYLCWISDILIHSLCDWWNWLQRKQPHLSCNGLGKWKANISVLRFARDFCFIHLHCNVWSMQAQILNSPENYQNYWTWS